MYAIIKTGGKQYRVSQGDEILVEKINGELGDLVTLEEVLAVSNEGKFVAGNPTVEGAKVTAKIVDHGKGKKIIVFKYKAKKDYRKKQGHRQPYSKILIESISI